VRICFVVADVAAQVPRFATVHLALAAARREHEVALAAIGDLTLEPSGRILAQVARPPMPGPDAGLVDYAEAIVRSATRTEASDLSGFDAVFLRYHPSREAASAGQRLNPALDFGVRLKAAGVTVVNDPEGAHTAGGRMYVSALPESVRPRALVTRSAEHIKRFLRELDGAAVLKPLADAHGAENVFYIGRGQIKNLNQIISVVRKTGYVVVQEYLPEAENGEHRLLLCDGEPLSAGGRVAIYKRTHPGLAESPPHFKSHLKTRWKRAEFDDSARRIVEQIGPQLRADGLFYVAVDLVGDKVLGVNVHTPGGLNTAEDLYGGDFAGAVIARLETRPRAQKLRAA
jgi:glutathione synthase